MIVSLKILSPPGFPILNLGCQWRQITFFCQICARMGRDTKNKLLWESLVLPKLSRKMVNPSSHRISKTLQPSLPVKLRKEWNKGIPRVQGIPYLLLPLQGGSSDPETERFKKDYHMVMVQGQCPLSNLVFSVSTFLSFGDSHALPHVGKVLPNS